MSGHEPAASSRRDSLHQTAGIAASVAALAEASHAADPLATSTTPLPTIALGSHRVTRLIIGGNPIYGYSHHNQLFSRHLTDWHTPERVLDLLRR